MTQSVGQPWKAVDAATVGGVVDLNTIFLSEDILAKVPADIVVTFAGITNSATELDEENKDDPSVVTVSSMYIRFSECVE